MAQNTEQIQEENRIIDISEKDPIKKLHDDARIFLSSQGLDFEGEFDETHDNEQIKFYIPHPEKEKKKIKCWLKCCYPKQNENLGFRITFGAFHPDFPQQDSKTFWSDSTFIITEEERKAAEQRIADGKQRAAEREKEEKKAADNMANWCKEKFGNASPRGISPYFAKKKVIPSDIRYEIRRTYSDGNYSEETIALIPLRDIKGNFKAIQEIYPSKRIFAPGTEPRDKNTLGKNSGCFFAFGKLIDGQPINISEGYSTAYSVFASTNNTSLMVVSRTNILNVANEVRKKYPNSPIIICGDDDKDTKGNPGRTDAIAAAQSINSTNPAKKCKVVFPKFPEGNCIDSNGKSFSDFNDLMIISGKEEVNRQINEEAFIPESPVPEKANKKKNSPGLPQNNLPFIKIIPGQLHQVTNYAENILSRNDLGIFQRGGHLVRIITEVSKPKKNKLLDKEGNEIIKRSADALLITEVDQIYLTELLGKNANWTRFDERVGDWIIRDCPERIAKTLIARREWNMPVLAGIIQAPTLRQDGSILDKPGYDEITGLFFNSGSTNFPSIPSHPTKDDAIQALEILLSLIKDFPFENEESKSVAISAILTGLIRKSIRTAPLHGYTAPKMGSGKSLLADIVGLIAMGKNNSAIPQAENEAEEKKRLLSVLAEGDSIICYDNIEQPFGSPALCSVLTQEEFKDRLLGVNRSLSVPTNATFLATGNNLSFIGDTSTRAILCRLDAQVERPEERQFAIDLRQYIPAYRGELVKAALTILRAYHVAGRPKQNIPQFGRFEDWSDWVRSSLVWLNMADPCASRKEIENADPTRKLLGQLLFCWHEYIGEMSFTLKQAIKKAESEKSEHDKAKAEALLDVFFENFSNGKGEINTRSLGKNLAKFANRIENGYRLEKTGTYQGVDTWMVKKIKKS